MALVRILAGGRVILPREVQEELQLKEGDVLEAEVVDGGLHLRPVTAAEREQAWQRVLDAPKSVRYIGPQPRPSPEEEEEWLAEQIEAARLEEHAKGRR